MKKLCWKTPMVVTVAVLALLLAVIVGFSVLTLAHALAPRRTDRALTADEAATVQRAAALMRRRGLTAEATLAERILQQQIWRAATPADPYLKHSEQAGDTPFAYTLASGHRPTAIVLAPRFFSETTPTARAALMIHEMGHYQAYVKTGRSDEFDGYKPEYDTHVQLGLGESDSLTYFAMLDGVAEYVVPRLPAYGKRPDVKAYMAQPGG